MIEKDLLRLVGEGKRDLVLTVIWMLLGLLGNIATTAGICCLVATVIRSSSPHLGAPGFVLPLLLAGAGIALRYFAACRAGDRKDALGRKVKKQLRERVYDKILRLGAHAENGIGMAGLTQMALEGIEQLDLYYSSYIPQFFYAMLSPLILFLVTVWIDWRVALTLLFCVPLIPLSIIAVSKYAKRILQSIGGSTPRWGTAFSTACRDWWS